MANVELSEDILASITVYANKMLHEVKLVLNTGNHEKRPELSVIADEKFRPVGLKAFVSSAILIAVPLLKGPFCA